MRLGLLAAIFFFAIASITDANAQDANFPDRKATVLNLCPHVELSKFSFQNRDYSRFEQTMSWKNIGNQPLVAFEIVILEYDAFDQRMVGTRWTVTGKNSADWRPLALGGSGSDGTRGISIEKVFTAIAYVRAARLNDGTVWQVNEAHLAQEIRKVAPRIREFGNLNPDPKQKTD